MNQSGIDGTRDDITIVTHIRGNFESEGKLKRRMKKLSKPLISTLGKIRAR